MWRENPQSKIDKKFVYHLNEHREGYAYRVYWDKNISRVKNHRYYHFTPSRKFSRELSLVLRTRPEIDYYL